MDPAQWSANLGSERDGGFLEEPNPHLNGRAIPMSMGKALGGGSSINVIVCARIHKSDWDFFASDADDAAWDYEAVLALYRRIESWQGEADPVYRGASGPMFLQPSPNPSPIAVASRACRTSAASGCTQARLATTASGVTQLLTGQNQDAGTP
jgi:choline dehydrogenase